MKPSQLLREKGWCQRHCAVTSNGISCMLRSPRAVAYSLTSAILLGDDSGVYYVDVYKRLCTYLGLTISGTRTLDLWNDDPLCTKEQVISALEAIGE